MDLKTFLGHFDGVKQSGGQHQARCEAHEDRTASLSIAEGDSGNGNGG